MSYAWKVFSRDVSCKQYDNDHETATARICYMLESPHGEPGQYVQAVADIVCLAGAPKPDSLDTKLGRFIVRIDGFREEIEMPTLEEAMALITIRYADTKGE